MHSKEQIPKFQKENNQRRNASKIEKRDYDLRGDCGRRIGQNTGLIKNLLYSRHYNRHCLMLSHFIYLTILRVVILIIYIL